MGELRVIRGSARGLRLRTVPGDTTRPITDRVKESLFNILGEDVRGSNWLDLFAGTGSVGIEALSNGAAFVRFIDLNHQPIETVRANLQTTRFTAKAEVLRMDAFALLARPADRQFEYVYIAPPQYKTLWQRALLSLDANLNWMTEDAWVIVQIHPREFEETPLKNLVLFEKRQYGSTLLVFYERREDYGHAQP